MGQAVSSAMIKIIKLYSQKINSLLPSPLQESFRFGIGAPNSHHHHRTFRAAKIKGSTSNLDVNLTQTPNCTVSTKKLAKATVNNPDTTAQSSSSSAHAHR
jgi:hypothetical protein